MADASTVAVAVYCDCCGKEKLAEIKGDKIIIYDTRHGQRHFVVINLKTAAFDRV